MLVSVCSSLTHRYCLMRSLNHAIQVLKNKRRLCVHASYATCYPSICTHWCNFSICTHWCNSSICTHYLCNQIVRGLQGLGHLPSLPPAHKFTTKGIQHVHKASHSLSILCYLASCTKGHIQCKLDTYTMHTQCKPNAH